MPRRLLPGRPTRLAARACLADGRWRTPAGNLPDVAVGFGYGPSMVKAEAELRHPLTQHGVRPPRAVTLVSSDDRWRADAIRMLECYSRT